MRLATVGWLSAGEKEAKEQVIAAQEKIIEGLKAQLQAIIDHDALKALIADNEALHKEVAGLKLLFAKRSEAIGTTAEADELQERLEQQRIKRQGEQ